jgi:2-polyprenyl-3-methyl-5-hydroxy-6-metoxy-1,4-benzoquinol methylase
MNHLDYYKFQAEARGVRSLEDVRRCARDKAHIYERVVQPWLFPDVTRPIGELACGHGSFLCWLKTRGYNGLQGVDSSLEQIQLAVQVGAQVDQDDVNTWLQRQPRNHFATLVGIDLVEHLPKDAFMELLRSAHGALAPGGSLILRLPNGDSPFVGMNLFNDITHVWTYTPNCLNSLAQMQAFSRTEFQDEGAAVLRDARWIKVPLARASAAILRMLIRFSTREKVQFLSPHLWARLVK